MVAESGGVKRGKMGEGRSCWKRVWKLPEIWSFGYSLGVYETLTMERHGANGCGEKTMNAIAIISILITWASYAAVITGLGAWRQMLFRREARTLDSYIDSFWCGLATLFGLLQAWHFVRRSTLRRIWC